MPFHDAFLDAYTRTKETLQRQAQVELQKQLGQANIEHMNLAGKVMLAESKRQQHEQQIKDMEAQAQAIAGGATFQTPGAAPTGETDESGAPLVPPSPDGTAPAAPAGNVVQTPFGAMTAPGPEDVARNAATKARAVGEATTAGERAGDVLPKELTITVAGMKPITIPAGTPAKAIPSIIAGSAGIREHQIAASATTTGLIQSMMGPNGMGGGPAAAPAAPAAAGPASGPAAAGPAPAASREQAIAEVPPFFRPQVQGLLDYTADPAKISQRSPMGMLTMNMAHKIDPNWSEATYKQRNALQTSFTSGEEANNIKNINTAAAHLETVSKAAEALKNGDLQLFNRLKNSFQTAAGAPEVTNYNMAAHVAAQEVAKVVHGAGVVPEGQGEAVDKNVAAVNSPDQLDGVFGMVAELMEGRMAAIQNKYETGMGKAPDKPLFMPKALDSIAKMKQRGGRGPAPAAGAVDALKQKHGISY